MVLELPIQLSYGYRLFYVVPISNKAHGLSCILKAHSLLVSLLKVVALPVKYAAAQ